MKREQLVRVLLFFIVSVSAVLSGCASNRLNQDLDTKLANEGEIRSRQDLQSQATQLKEIASANDNSDEIQLIKERLRKNEDKRLTVLFKAADDATGIFGKDTFQEKQRQQAVQSLVEIPYGNRAN